MHSVHGECRARSDCMYVQSDLALHCPKFSHQSLPSKAYPFLFRSNQLQYVCITVDKSNSAVQCVMGDYRFSSIDLSKYNSLCETSIYIETIQKKACTTWLINKSDLLVVFANSSNLQDKLLYLGWCFTPLPTLHCHISSVVYINICVRGLRSVSAKDTQTKGSSLPERFQHVAFRLRILQLTT